mmetsp:Transcript_9519/g.28771  ORF Transcript_9519/g.28771 Transcript_9519/m.28771 type:complete len:201 (-) Transcript_9519:1711-2313(-)
MISGAPFVNSLAPSSHLATTLIRASSDLKSKSLGTTTGFDPFCRTLSTSESVGSISSRVQAESSKSFKSTSSPTTSPLTLVRAWHEAISLLRPSGNFSMSCAKSAGSNVALLTGRIHLTSRPSSVRVPVLSKQRTSSQAARVTALALVTRILLCWSLLIANTRPKVTVAGSAGGSAMVTRSRASSSDMPRERLNSPTNFR